MGDLILAMHHLQPERTDQMTDITFGDDCIDPSFPYPPNLDATAQDVLLDQFYKNVNFFLTHIQRYQISELRSEVYERVKNRSLFQAKVFGNSSTNFDVLPQNSFSSFVVSLHLILKSDSYIFYSSAPGLEIQENYDDHGWFLLEFISKGMLPPNAIDDIKKINLKWYDGGLICQIEDQRRLNIQIMRVLLRLNNSDIVGLGTDSESSYLLARYPYICFDNDIQVSRIARIAANDHIRWKEKKKGGPTAKELVQQQYPSLLINRIEDLDEVKEKEQKLEKNGTNEQNTDTDQYQLLFDKIAKLAETQ